MLGTRVVRVSVYFVPLAENFSKYYLKRASRLCRIGLMRLFVATLNAHGACSCVDRIADLFGQVRKKKLGPVWLRE